MKKNKCIALVMALIMTLSFLPMSLATDATDAVGEAANYRGKTLPLNTQEKELPSLQKLTQKPTSSVYPTKVQPLGEIITSTVKNNTTLYGFNTSSFNPTEKCWFSMNSNDPSTVTFVSDPLDYSSYYAAAEYYNGTIYTVLSTSPGTYVFGTVDTATFEFSELAPSQDTQSLSMDHSTGTMYAMCGNTINTVNMTTGEFTAIAQLQGLTNNPVAMVLNTVGTMYVVEATTGILYEINKTDGSSLLIGSTMTSPDFAQSMTYDHANQTLYWALYPGSTGGQLATIDTGNARTTILGSIGTGYETTCLMTFEDNVTMPDPVPVSGVEISPRESLLVVNDTLQFLAFVLPTDAYVLDRSCTWSSDNESIAQVSTNGLVSAIAPGTAHITVTTNDGGYSDSATITVISIEEAQTRFNEAINAPGSSLDFINDPVNPWKLTFIDDRSCVVNTNHEEMSTGTITLQLGSVVGGSTLTWDYMVSSELNYDGISLIVNGETVQLYSGELPWTTATYTFPKSDNYTVSWAYGKDGYGTAGLDCGWIDNVAFEATQPAAVTGVELTPKQKTMLVGDTLELTANVLPINAQNGDVVFSSDNQAVATVDQSGIVTAVAVGQATITVTTDEGNFSDSCTISVETLPEPIYHTEMDYSQAIIPGEMITHTLAFGSATRIYIPLQSGELGSLVGYAVGYSAYLEAGQALELRTSSPIAHTLFAFNSDFELVGYGTSSFLDQAAYLKLIATVSGTYNVLLSSDYEAVTGDVVFYATEFEPIHATGVTIMPESMTIGTNKYGTFSATVMPYDTDFPQISWSIEDDTIASIDENTGLVHGLNVGVTTVTVTTLDGGFTASSTLTVEPSVNPQYDGFVYGYNLFDQGEFPMGMFKMNPDISTEEFELVLESNIGINAAEYYNGLYYCSVLIDMVMMQIPYYFIIDPSTWEIQVIMPDQPKAALDMAFDYTTNTMYCLVDNEFYQRSLATLELETGVITVGAPIKVGHNELAMNLACDSGGHLYTITDNGTLYEIVDKSTGDTDTIGNTGYAFSYTQCMMFNHNTQEMYVAQLDVYTESSNFLKINRRTAEVISSSPLNSGFCEVVGMFTFIDPEDVIEPPVSATGMTMPTDEVELDVGESLRLPLKFVPAETTNREAIWTSTSDAIATVDERGVVVAKAPGSCYIEAVSKDGGFSARALITVNTPEPSDIPEGFCRVTLSAEDVWGNGTGYQMLLDSDATAYGTLIPKVGPLSPMGDAPQEVYDEFEYKIPENADGALNTQNIILDGSASILVPAGTYDFCITNPSELDYKVWIAVNGRGNDFVMEAGYEYTFDMIMNSGYDLCVWGSSWAGFEGELKEYVKATFLNSDESLIAESIVEKGSLPLAPNNPAAPEGYVFAGWDKPLTEIDSDTTFVAVYTRDPRWADVNLDGETNTGDAAAILRYAAKLDELTPEQLSFADANKDGDVNTGDAATILRFVAFGE